MKKYVLDSFALFVFFEQQKDWEKIERFLVQASEGRIELMMSLINYGELFYVTAQKEGTREAEKIIALVDQLPLKISQPDRPQTLLAATFKARGGISYVDCFAAALAYEFKAKLITGDSEFKKLKNEVDIEWIEK
ncbi:MAG: type II toxin-antitoxin system VapC family toxin [Bacteroidetes bacterium]|nr:type II toxin-antitoxin system VapC family toxin [Bacteroidota bacterium]